MIFINKLEKNKQKELKNMIDELIKLEKKRAEIFKRMGMKINKRAKMLEEIKMGRRPIEHIKIILKAMKGDEI